MKQKVGPVAIVVAVVVVIIALAAMYRMSFPPSPPNDTDNAKGMPLYAQNYMKNRKPGQPQPAGPPGQTAPLPGGSMGGSAPGR